MHFSYRCGFVASSLLAMRLSAMGCVALGLIAFGDDATARTRYQYYNSEQVPQHQKKPEEPLPKGPFFLVISLKKQHVSVYNASGLVARGPVSSGDAGHTTPSGVFTVLEKEYFHRSNLYSGAPMPFMQRLTWSGVALHAGYLPGYPASHGCIRMPEDFAKRLFKMTKAGERVIVTGEEVAPVSFSHPRLPVAKLLAAPPSENLSSAASQVLKSAMNQVAKSATDGKLDVAMKPEYPAGSEAGTRLVNPFEFAQIMKGQATAKIEAAAAAEKSARLALPAINEALYAATIEFRKAEAALSNTKDRLAYLDLQMKRTQNPEALKLLETQKTATEAALKEAETRFAAAQEAKTDKSDRAAAAAQAVKDAEDARRAAADAPKTWARKLEPVSVFISRKTSRIYVRQGFRRLFDYPVTIRDLDEPIGTHSYLAVHPEGSETGKGYAKLSWLSLTVSDALTDGSTGEWRGRHYRPADPSKMPHHHVSTASEALDRIDIPAEASEKISELLWTGASLTISDNALSYETGDYTDFIVLTR